MANDPAGIKKRQKEAEKKADKALEEIYRTYSWLKIWESTSQEVSKYREGISSNLKEQIEFSLRNRLKDVLQQSYRDGVYWFYKAYSNQINEDVLVPRENKAPYISKEMLTALQLSYEEIKKYISYTVEKIIEEKISAIDLDFDAENRSKEKLLGLSYLIARTEPNRQKVHGAVDAANSAGIKSFSIIAETPDPQEELGEFTTANDSKVCPRCKSLDGKVLELDQIKSLIPVHRYCRCWFKFTDQYL